jgi:Mg2+/Co2+ transporter CorB
MDDIPLSTQLIILVVLLLLSGFFAMAETAMMVANRHRLRHLAQEGHRGAQLAHQLLGRVDRLISVVLIANTLINAAAAMLTGHIALSLLGAENWALEAGTIFITFCLLVFSEITPKVIGATYPDWLSLRLGYILVPLQRISRPVVWFVNLFVGALLKLLHLEGKGVQEIQRVSPEDLRAMVLDAGHFIPPQHQSMLLNLFELERIEVDDIMTPRGEIEGIDLQAPLEEIQQQLATSFHTRLLVYEDDPGNVIGILHQRRLLAAAISGQLDLAGLREQVAEPYYIPAGTTIYAQLQFFQENRQRVGLVVDEYGEIMGLLTLEDIIEEIVGKFTTNTPGNKMPAWTADEQDGAATVLVDGAATLRDLNRELELSFPLDGPNTLNGLILEHLEDIPEAGLSVKINDVPMEIVQAQDRRIRMVRIFRPPNPL